MLQKLCPNCKCEITSYRKASEAQSVFKSKYYCPNCNAQVKESLGYRVISSFIQVAVFVLVRKSFGTGVAFLIWVPLVGFDIMLSKHFYVVEHGT